MKLWILRPVNGLSKVDNPWEPWYDKAFGFVARAETEAEARVLAHGDAGEENRMASHTNFNSPWLDAKY
jgi:hypothetical protein